MKFFFDTNVLVYLFDVGVDFSHIWPAAQMMHAARNP